jgi:hypothetical protein
MTAKVGSDAVDQLDDSITPLPQPYLTDQVNATCLDDHKGRTLKARLVAPSCEPIFDKGRARRIIRPESKWQPDTFEPALSKGVSVERRCIRRSRQPKRGPGLQWLPA